MSSLIAVGLQTTTVQPSCWGTTFMLGDKECVCSSKILKADNHMFGETLANQANQL